MAGVKPSHHCPEAAIGATKPGQNGGNIAQKWTNSPPVSKLSCAATRQPVTGTPPGQLVTGFRTWWSCTRAREIAVELLPAIVHDRFCFIPENRRHTHSVMAPWVGARFSDSLRATALASRSSTADAPTSWHCRVRWPERTPLPRTGLPCMNRQS